MPKPAHMIKKIMVKCAPQLTVELPQRLSTLNFDLALQRFVVFEAYIKAVDLLRFFCR